MVYGIEENGITANNMLVYNIFACLVYMYCSSMFLDGTAKNNTEYAPTGNVQNSKGYALFVNIPRASGMTLERRISYTFAYVFIYLSCHSQVHFYVPDASHSHMDLLDLRTYARHCVSLGHTEHAEKTTLA